MRAQLILEEALLVLEMLGEPENSSGDSPVERGLLDQHAPYTPRQFLLALSCVCRHVVCLSG